LSYVLVDLKIHNIYSRLVSESFLEVSAQAALAAATSLIISPGMKGRSPIAKSAGNAIAPFPVMFDQR
jgi:hypothetical protein